MQLKYRQAVKEAIAGVVRERLGKARTISFIHDLAAGHVDVVDRARFIEIVEDELISLHEGSIARFRLGAIEFRAWRDGWR